MYKYIILDFGGVIVTPTTGYWDITPKFLELIDIDLLDKNLLKEKIKKYSYIKSEKIISLEEEYDMFNRFYTNVLSDFNISKDVINDIAYDRVYGFDKYKLYDNVVDELNKLKEKYKLILLSDNWPSVIEYMREYKIYDYFDKVYISSIYGVEKKDRVFFDYMINDYDIKEGDALFIDDNENNLEIASEKGLDVFLLDRSNNKTSKFKRINDLYI